MARVEQSLNQRYVDVEKLDAKLRQLFAKDFAYNVCLEAERRLLEWVLLILPCLSQLVGNMYILSVPRELTKVCVIMHSGERPNARHCRARSKMWGMIALRLCGM